MAGALVLGCGDDSPGAADAAQDVDAAQPSDAAVGSTPDAPVADAATPDAAPPLYFVGGTLSGLEGEGLVLRNGGGDDLALDDNGTFQFATPLADGSAYDVTVAQQPTAPQQFCDVSRGSGMVQGADVDDVTVECTSFYPLRGHVFGLEGSGLVLENADGQVLAIAADGPFAFEMPLADEMAYAVTVRAQPAMPAQDCLVYGGSGVVTASTPPIVVDCGTSEVARIALSTSESDGSAVRLMRVFPGGIVPRPEDVIEHYRVRYLAWALGGSRLLVHHEGPALSPAHLDVYEVARGVPGDAVRLDEPQDDGRGVSWFRIQPGGEQIVFQADPQVARDLFAASASSPVAGAPTLLTDMEGSTIGLSGWHSPSYYAFQMLSDGARVQYLSHAEGGGMTAAFALVGGDPDGGSSGAVIAPGEDRVAFLAPAVPDGPAAVHLAPLQAGVVGTPAIVGDWAAAGKASSLVGFSSDGDVLFVSVSVALGRAELYAVDVSGAAAGAPVRIMVPGFPYPIVQGMATRPGSSAVVFDVKGVSIEALFVADASSKPITVERATPTLLEDESITTWTLSPDGAWMGFHFRSFDAARRGTYVVSTDDPSRSFRIGDGGLPSFSPRGRYVFFTAVDPGEGEDVRDAYLVDLGSGTPAAPVEIGSSLPAGETVEVHALSADESSSGGHPVLLQVGEVRLALYRAEIVDGQLAGPPRALPVPDGGVAEWASTGVR